MPSGLGDRLDITGARWGRQGAPVVLKLRALHSKGDFDTYWCYQLTRGTGASTTSATRTLSPLKPDQPVPEMEPHLAMIDADTRLDPTRVRRACDRRSGAYADGRAAEAPPPRARPGAGEDRPANVCRRSPAAQAAD